MENPIDIDFFRYGLKIGLSNVKLKLVDVAKLY